MQFKKNELSKEIHTTANEIKFINGLGTRKFSTITTPRIKLLRKYITTLRARDNFDLNADGQTCIAKAAVLKHALKELDLVANTNKSKVS